jgi:hypothetical protein
MMIMTVCSFVRPYYVLSQNGDTPSDLAKKHNRSKVAALLREASERYEKVEKLRNALASCDEV